MALLGMLDPTKWQKREDATVVDENRVLKTNYGYPKKNVFQGLTYLTQRFKNADYSLVKLHEVQKKFEEKSKTDETIAAYKSPIDNVADLLQSEWPLSEKKKGSKNIFFQIFHSKKNCDYFNHNIETKNTNRAFDRKL